MFFKKKVLNDNLFKIIQKKDRPKRYFLFLIGVFIVAISFNLFLVKSDVVYGISGIGIILKEMFGYNPSQVIFLGSIFLLFVSFLILGKEKSLNSVVGSLLYPCFIKLTENIGNYMDLSETDPTLIVLFGAIISGFGYGLIFKSGFTTGGTDIINQAISKHFKISLGTSMIIVDGLIVLSSLVVFGPTKLIYSLLSLYIISIITDKVILGISNSKAFYIITEHETEVKKFLINSLGHGVTVLDGRGGFTGNYQKVLMCIIPTKEYYIVKEAIGHIDPKAFFVVTDSYEVQGAA